MSEGYSRRAEIALLVLAFIVCAIAFHMVDRLKYQTSGFPFFFSGREFFGVAYDSNYPAKSGEMALCASKDIVVFCPAQEIEVFFAFLDLQDVLRANSRIRWARDNAAQNIGLWWDQACANFNSRIIEIKTNGQMGVTQQQFGVHGHVLGGRFATISPNRPEAPRISAVYRMRFPILFESSSKYKSALTGHHMVSRDTDGGFANFKSGFSFASLSVAGSLGVPGQEKSSEPQEKSEERKDACDVGKSLCPQRDPFFSRSGAFAMFFFLGFCLAGWGQIISYRDDRRGWVLIGAGFTFVILAMWTPSGFLFG